MIYAVISLALAFLGTLTWLVIWTGRLKDAQRKAEKVSSDWEIRHQVLAQDLILTKQKKVQLERQLASSRSSFDDLVQKIESGSFNDMDGILDLLRNGVL